MKIVHNIRKLSLSLLILLDLCHLSPYSKSLFCSVRVLCRSTFSRHQIKLIKMIARFTQTNAYNLLCIFSFLFFPISKLTNYKTLRCFIKQSTMLRCSGSTISRLVVGDKTEQCPVDRSLSAI